MPNAPTPSTIYRQALTASKLHIATACPGAFALPAYSEVGGAFARRGTVIHRFIDRAFKEGRDAALARVPDDLAEFCEGLRLEELAGFIGTAPESEVAVSYNPAEDVAVRLDEVEERQYPKEDGWIPGTLDALDVDAARGVTFGDWKTGFLMVVDPEDNLQVRHYAIAVARIYEVDAVEGLIVHLDEDGNPRVKRTVFDADALAAIALQLAGVQVKVAEAIASFDAGVLPRLRTGEHCTYCAAFASCPAISGSVQALMPYSDRLPAITPEKAGEAYRLANVVRVAAERVLDFVREFARREDLPIGDGKVLREIKVPRETIDGSVVRQVLEDLGKGAAFFTAAKVSKAGLETALGAELAAEVLGRTRERGGAHRGEYSKVIAVKAKKAKA